MLDDVRYAIRYRSEWSDKLYWYVVGPLLAAANLLFFLGGSVPSGIVLAGYLLLSFFTLAIKGQTMKMVHARKNLYSFTQNNYERNN